MKQMKWIAPAMALFFLASCQKDVVKQLTPEESQIYITSYDSSAQFTSYKTFSIADSVGILKDGKASKELTPNDQAYLNAVKQSMQAEGYELVSREDQPDLAINVMRIYNTHTGYFSYNDYWDYYGSYWDPYYWGYPGYGYYVPYAYGTYQVTEGMISVDMFDLKNAKQDNQLNLIWNGLIRGNGIFNSDNATTAVNALFSQSPYLHSNG